MKNSNFYAVITSINTLVILKLFGNNLKSEPKFTGMLWMYSVRIELPTSFLWSKLVIVDVLLT